MIVGDMSIVAGLLGESPALLAVRQTIERLLRRPGDAGRLPPILVLGETGTGKGLLARAIHEAGPRRGGPFVAVNCAAIPETLLEAELFGFERGAFTDARQAKPGLFQTAHRGSLFLDEVGLLPEALQAKLLTVLEERQVRRLGSTRAEPVDVWILAASNEDLLTRRGRFREDLYHRLAVVTLALPPLRERGRDVVLLAEHFLARAASDYRLGPRTLAPDAATALMAYRWPGNVRELANVMERVALLAEAREVTAAMLDLPVTASASARAGGDIPTPPAATPPDDPVARLAWERDRLRTALEATGWNISQAALQLGVPRNTLRYRIGKLGLRPGAGARPSRPAESLAPPAAPVPVPGPVAASPSPPGTAWTDRRLVFLRVALTGSGEGAERPLDATRALEAFVEKLGAFGGRVEEVGPTSLVAAFGLEPAEDATRRAAHAALAIRRLAVRAQRVDAARGPVALALHAGTCAVARVGDAVRIDPGGKREAIAALEALTAGTDPDEILASAVVAPFLERRFELALSPSRLALPGPVYRVVGLGGGQSVAPLVGRRAELEMLRSRLASVRQGEGQIVGIAGEAGIGKSRLLAEFRQGLLADGLAFLEGQALSYGSGIPYLPLLEVLRRHVGIGEADAPELMAGKLRTGLERAGLDPEEATPYLAHLLGLREGAERVATLSPEAIQVRLFDILGQLLLRASRERPLVVAIEDLHWIDTASERFLGGLAERLPGTAILLLLTYRPGYGAPAMTRSYASQITLQPLGSEESRTLVRALLPAGGVPEPVLARIVDKAGGNPFFLEELTRVLGGEGAAGPAVPDTVQEVLLARIERLGEAPRRLLQALAVLGREVSRRLANAVWEGPEPFEPTLGELVRQEFLHERVGLDEPVCVFKHALTRDVARDSLPPARRQALHAAAGRALEALYAGRLEEACDRLAYHFSKARDAERAVRYLTDLADKAARSYAHVEAVAALEEALGHVTRLGEADQDRLRLDLVLRQARSLSFLGRFLDVRERLQGEAARVARLPEPALAASFHFWLAHTESYLGEHAEATKSAERALEEGRRAGDEATMGKAYVVLAQESYWAGQPLRGIAQGARAVELLGRAGERWWLGLAQWIVGINHVILGTFRPALEAEARALAIGESLGDPRIQSYATWSSGWIHALTGSWDAGIEECRRALERAPDPVNAAVALGHLGYVFLEQGDAGQAIPRLAEAARQMQEFGFRRLHGRFTTFLGEAHLLAGELGRARDLVAQGREVTAAAQYWYGLGWAQQALGRIAFAAGDLADAEGHLKEALRTFELVQARFMMGRTRVWLAEVARARGDRTRAGRELQTAHALFRVLDVPHYVGRVERLARELDTLLSDETLAPHLAIVRRGEAELFQTLTEHLEALGLRQVVWDRRVAERRGAGASLDADRRQGERRRATPDAWDRLGFLFAP
jgi:DNA-binding NtrC family response regulator/tetratricopeptide (TPR) repeat protein